MRHTCALRRGTHLFWGRHLVVKLEAWLTFPKIFVFGYGKFLEHDAPEWGAMVLLSSNYRHALFTREADDAFQIRHHRARRRRFVGCTLCHESILHIDDYNCRLRRVALKELATQDDGGCRHDLIFWLFKNRRSNKGVNLEDTVNIKYHSLNTEGNTKDYSSKRHFAGPH